MTATLGKYRDRLLVAAIRLVDRNRLLPYGEIVGDLDYLETVDAILEERSDVVEENIALRDNNRAVKALFDERAAAIAARTSERDQAREATQTQAAFYERRLQAAEATVASLRSALEKLVGASTRDELQQMEAVMRLMPGPAEDKAAAIDAIHALLALSASSTTGVRL